MSKRHLITRRELIKQFGFTAFLLHPIVQSMAYAAEAPTFAAYPRYLQIFRGGGWLPNSYLPAAINNLAGKVTEPLQALNSDIVLFKNLTMSQGYRDEDGGRGDEHGGGTAICFTGGRIHCWKKNGGDGQDSYGWEAWDISVDQKIAEYYKTLPALATVPIPFLNVGVGLNSGAGPQIYCSFKQGAPNQTGLANAVPIVGDPSVTYTQIMDRIMSLCNNMSNQPVSDNAAKIAILTRKKSIVDFQLERINSAKIKLGMDSEHSRRLDGMVAHLADVEKQIRADITLLQNGGGTPPTTGKSCPMLTKPATLSSSAIGSLNKDVTNVRYDQFNQLIKLAFEWDLTRVVNYMMDTGSNETTFASGGAPNSHHNYAHNNSTAQLFASDKHAIQKIADLWSMMKATNDPDGRSMLYNSTSIVGMDTWGSQHSRTNMPFIFAGQGGGKIQTGRIVDAGGRSQNDLLLASLKASGMNLTVFGKSQYCKGSLL